MRISRNRGDVLILLVAIALCGLLSSRAVGQDFKGLGRGGAVIYNAPLGSSYTAMGYVDGTFTYQPNLYTPGFDTLRACDYNGDGLADLIVYNSQNALGYIGMGKGDGTFTFQSLFWSAGYDIVECGDINGDGMADVALSTIARQERYMPASATARAASVTSTR